MGERNVQGNAAGQRHVALAGQQGLRRGMHGDQRCRACGLHRHRRAGESELVRDPAGQEVSAGCQAQLQLRHLWQAARMRPELLEVARISASPVHADRALVALRVMPSMLERLPRALKEYPVLRVDQQGLAWRVTEEASVEHVTVGNDASGRSRYRFVAVAEPREGLAAACQIRPELVDAAAAGKSTGHPDHSDAGEIFCHQIESMNSRRLFGRMSVHTRAMCARHSAFDPAGPAMDQPSGGSESAGHNEYWSSSLRTTW